jgi:hypothetical protein
MKAEPLRHDVQPAIRRPWKAGSSVAVPLDRCIGYGILKGGRVELARIIHVGWDKVA